MGAVRVVVADVCLHRGLELTAGDDRDPVQAFAPERADPAFADRVGSGCPHGRLYHPQALRAEHLIERSCEERVSVVDQELPRAQGVAQLDGEVAGLLGDHAAVG